MFYNQFLPGGTGGDIIKELPAAERDRKKAGALLAVVFDRFIGLVALVTITVTLVSLRFDLLWRTPVTVEARLHPAPTYSCCSLSSWHFDYRPARQFCHQRI